MRSSEARHIMEEHLAAFFEASPDDIPADLVPDVSPLFAMGCVHGLSVESAGRYVQWLQETGRVSPEQAIGLQQIVDHTAEVLAWVARER